MHASAIIVVTTIPLLEVRCMSSVDNNAQGTYFGNMGSLSKLLSESASLYPMWQQYNMIPRDNHFTVAGLLN